MREDRQMPHHPPVDESLAGFSALTRDWFGSAFSAPTNAQVGAWRAIHRGKHTLVVAPTGSGKTLAAFLAAIDRLATAAEPAPKKQRCRVLYISPSRHLLPTSSETSAVR